jgi:isopentenyl-diphosphate delta-isomerase
MTAPDPEAAGNRDTDAAGRHARKDDHLRLAAAQWTTVRQDGHRAGPGSPSTATAPSARNEFDDLEFVHHALGGVSLADVDLSVDFLGRHLPSPFYINGMTGGTVDTGKVNRELAIAARETGLAMACGSVSIALEDETAADGFRVIRQENPDGFVMANIGVGRSAEDAVRAVDLLQADALQLHVNAVQETVMPESVPDFGSWLDAVAAVVAASPVPVLVKEVGFGLSPRTLDALAGIGVSFADVSGKGGTDFLRIENDRRPGADYAYLTGFGQSAAACLLEATTLPGAHRPHLLASGGVRTPLDVLRALSLGAEAVGVAGNFLRTVVDSGAEGLIMLITQWQQHTRELAALLGARDVAELQHLDLLVRGSLAEYGRLRGLDLVTLARRSESTSSHPFRTPEVPR